MENHTRAADAKAKDAELSISPFALEVWLEKKQTPDHGNWSMEEYYEYAPAMVCHPIW